MSNYLHILSKYTSSAGAALAIECLEKFPFHLKIVWPRKTRLGDYSYDFKKKYHQITINNDLEGDAFLFTLLHEIAHQWVQLNYANRVEPHGDEWKHEYRTLLLKALELNAFANAHLIIKSIDNIKSSSVYNKDIFRTLYSKPSEDELFLDLIPNGTDFIFNATIYTKIQKNRSRSLCLNTENQRQYLISNQALVMIIED